MNNRTLAYLLGYHLLWAMLFAMGAYVVAGSYDIYVLEKKSNLRTVMVQR